MEETLLVTGGLGFIGSNFLHGLDRTGWKGKVVNVDAMTYAGSRENVAGAALDMCLVVEDVADEEAMDAVFGEHKPGMVVNFAAESHVDRSIASAAPFVRSNVVGVQVLLDASRKHGVRRFLQVSTDEVYGSLGPDDPPSREGDMLRPSSPYSASKTAADLLVLAYHRTHGMDVVVTRCSNNYGPRQYPEKLVPLAIRRLAEGGKVPVYGKGENVRDWIYVDDHCRGIMAALSSGKAGEVYNFGGGNQVRNIELVRLLVRRMGRGDEAIEFVADRPGHDLRYDMDYSKSTRELGWYPEVTFEDGMRETVEWYGENEGWK